MTLTIHGATVPVFTRALANLSHILDLAAGHCEDRRIDPAVLLGMRLAPDMFPLTRQVQIASDFAKGTVARLAGREPPRWDDTEASFAELKARIARTIDFVQGYGPAQLDAAADRQVTLKMTGEDKTFTGLAYLQTVALPNFWFHTTTAYAILRHAGVPLGKRDFIGAI